MSRGEEVRINIGTTASKVTFSTPGTSVDMPIVGVTGYSMGTGAGTIPYYVGSLAVSGTNSVTIADTCPSQIPFSATITDFDIELLQPAFGIADASSNDKAFPAGAFYLQGFVTIDGQSLVVRAVNEDPVYLTATPSGFFAGDLELNVDVPCGAGTIPVSVQIDLRSSGTPIARPPTMGIASPSSVACPGTLVLSHNASDPDADLSTVRWYVDDVLLAPGVTTIPMTTGHTLRAVARDTRGATTTATSTVVCN